MSKPWRMTSPSMCLCHPGCYFEVSDSLAKFEALGNPIFWILGPDSLSRIAQYIAIPSNISERST
jgi:hypothetical protein